MTQSELINAINTVKANKLEDIKGRINIYSNSSFYIIVYNGNQVSRTTNISFIYTADWRYAFIIVDYGYLVNSFSKNNWELIGFINPTGFISTIDGDKWILESVSFGYTKYGYMAPELSIKSKNDPHSHLNYDTEPDKFDIAWNFFLELNTHCSSQESAEIYKMFYKERIQTQEQSLTLSQYKATLAQKDLIINQYQGLLKLIEERLIK